MNAANFAKGMGVGLVVGSAVGAAVASGAAANQQKQHHCCQPQNGGNGKRGSVVGKALKAMGDIVDSIGDSIGM